MAAELWVQTYNSSSSRPRVTWPAAGSGTVALPRRVSRGAPARAAANLDSGLLAPKPQLKARADGASAESKTRRPMTPHDRSIRMCRAVARLSRAGPRGRAPAAPGPHRVGVLPVPRRAAAARSARGGVWFAPRFLRFCRSGFAGARYCRAVHADFILFSMRWTVPDFIYRVKDVGRVTLSHRGPARARLFTRSVCLVTYVLSSLSSIASARPCCLLLALALLLGRLRPAGVRCTTCHSRCSCPFPSAPCGVEASSPCRCCSSSPCRCRPPRT